PITDPESVPTIALSSDPLGKWRSFSLSSQYFILVVVFISFGLIKTVGAGGINYGCKY
ncbi:3254_t:CDS:1, partial [Gigaspora rosea]